MNEFLIKKIRHEYHELHSFLYPLKGFKPFKG